MGRRPGVSAHAGADTGAGIFTPHGVGGAAFEPLQQRRDRQGGRVVHERVHVVGFAVELDQLDVEFGADGAHDVLAEGEHLVGEHRPPVFGHEHQMRVQQGHAVSGAAIGLGCQWSAPTVVVCRCVTGTASNRHRPLGRGSRPSVSRVRGSVQRARLPMCGRGRCARIRRSAGMIRTRFFTGTRVYNAVLGEFLARSRAVKSDPAWQTARQLPRADPGRAEGPPRGIPRGGAGTRVQCGCGAVVRIVVAQIVGARTSARPGDPESGGPRVRRGQAVARRLQGQAAVQVGSAWAAFVGGQGRSRCAAPEHRCGRPVGRVAVGCRVRGSDRRARPGRGGGGRNSRPSWPRSKR